MTEGIVVRVLQNTQSHGGILEAGWIVELPLDIAARHIAAEHMEPFVSIVDHEPILPDKGVSLSEAYDNCVRKHPDIKEFSVLRGESPIFAAQDFMILPTWAEVVDRRRLCDLADVPIPDDSVSPFCISDVQEPAKLGGVVIQIGKLQKEITRSIDRFTQLHVLHRFLEQLAAGKLLAHGVWEDDLATLEARPIPSGWWERDVIVDLRKCEIRERTAENRGPGVRRWSRVLVTSHWIEEEEAQIGGHADKAKLRPALILWLEKETHRRGANWNKKQYLEAAQRRFGEGVSKNLFNEIWKVAKIPDPCRAAGRRR